MTLAVLGTVIAAAVTVVGQGGAGVLSRWLSTPSQRQMRWLLKHGHVAEPLTAEQLITLTQAGQAEEMRTQRAALPRPEGTRAMP